MRRFLRYDLEEYLMGRAVERKKELPLAQNENQPYIHYRKGSLAMYLLQDLLGEDGQRRAAPSCWRTPSAARPTRP
jgi:ABC-2 type transport system permease protein